MHDEYLGKRSDNPLFRNESVAKDMKIIKNDCIGNINEFKHLYYYNVFQSVNINMDTGFDGVHSMERARAEANGFILVLKQLHTDIDAWGFVNKFTVGQIMCFFVFALIIISVILGEIIRYFFFIVKVNNREVCVCLFFFVFYVCVCVCVFLCVHTLVFYEICDFFL